MEPQQTPTVTPQEPPTITPQQTPTVTTQAPSVEIPTVVAPMSPTIPLNDQPVINKIWSKTIKTVNFITLLICLGFLLLIDLPILLNTPALIVFFVVMLVALGLFVGCMLFELWTSKRLQNTPQSSLDQTILVLAILRNIIIVLNVIPFIQLIGLFVAGPFALLFILANAIMITIRLRQKPAATTPAFM